MKDLLVIADPIDREQLALKHALAISTGTEAKIHVLIFCYEAIDDLHSAKHDNGPKFDLKTMILEQAANAWERVSNEINPGKVTITHEIIWEKHIHSWVIEHCKTHHYDLLFKTGHRSESFYHTPTDWQLVRQGNVPFYCVSEEPVPPPKKGANNILVALDLRASSKEKKQLNNRLLDLACAHAKQTGADVHCCYAIHIPTLVKDMDLIDVPAHVHQLESELRADVDGWLEMYDLDQSRLHIREGAAELVIDNFVRELKAQVVVIGSLGHSGLAGRIIGNTAEKVMHRSTTHVLVL